MAQRHQLAAFSAFVSIFLASIPAASAQDDAATTAAETQEVTVTGSRIRRESGFDYPVPVAVVGGRELRESGFTVLGDALQNLPQALNNVGAQNTSASLFNSGQSRVDLRGLGSVRTLVLVDGRRQLTGDFRTSAVDLNLIPSTLIERIEAISGGASAVYGSEAISGVVNIILRKKMEGIELDFQGGVTQENDGEEWKASAGYGRSLFGERGQFLIGAEYGKVEPILQIDRDWAFPGIRRNTGVNPQTVVTNSRSTTMPTATFQLIGAPRPAGEQRSVSIALDRSAVIANSAACRTATVSALCQDEHLFYNATYNALQGGLDRLSARTFASYELTDSAELYTDLNYSRVDGLGIFQPAFSNAAGGGLLSVALRGDNAYLNGPGDLATQLRGFWQQAGLAFTQTAAANVGKFWEEFGYRNSRVYRESYKSILGVGGGFELLDRDVDYDVYGQYSRLNGYTIGYNVPNVQRVLQATDAVLLNGQVVCRSAAARAAGCVPWDLINGASADAIAWANANARADGLASQTLFAADMSTTLLELPAGGLGFAVGAEYRKEKSDQIQDDLSASGALFYNAIGRTQGEYDLTEAYAEIVVPLLKDVPFAHRLSVEAAGRIGDYSTVGGVNQWRIAADWAPVPDIRFRASTSYAVRAPNITELFSPQGQNFTTAGNDPCDRTQIAGVTDPARLATRIANCSAAIPGYNPATFVSNFGTGRPSLQLLQGGNPDLEEEAADTYTVGFVVSPRWVENLQMSFDYFSIEVDNAVSVIPINTLLQNLCYDVDQTPPVSNRFCGFISRDPTGASTGGLVGGVTNVVLTQQNVQTIATQGFDVSLSYSRDFGAIGALQARLDGTKTLIWDLQGVPGGPTTHYAGTITGVNGAVPEWKLGAGLGWSFRQFAAQINTRYLSSLGVSETLDPSSLAPFKTGDYFEHDLRATYKYSDALTLRLGVINLTNEIPPLVPEAGAGTGTGSSVYDNRGRWFFVGGNYSFK